MSRRGERERTDATISCSSAEFPGSATLLPMKLYFAPRTRASRPRWLLEELGVPYELVRLDLSTQENRAPEFLAVSPLGQLPALVDGDTTLLEPSAICLYLADRSPEKQLAPPPR